MWQDITHLFTTTEPIDRVKAAMAMKEFYEYCGEAEPEIVFVDGPRDLAAHDFAELEGLSFFDKKELAQFVTKRGIGKGDRIKSDISGIFWKYRRPKKLSGKFVGSSALLVPEDYEYNQDFQDEFKWFKFATAVWDNSLLTLNFKGRSYILDRAAVVKTNDRGLHCDDGPALVFRDGSEFCFWNSERLTKRQFDHPHRIPLEDIHAHPNKHVLIAFVGVDHYLQMCREWEPDVKGKFQKFFSFAEMVVPEDSLIPNSRRAFDRKGKGWMFDDGQESWKKNKQPYMVEFSKATVNGKYGTVLSEKNYSGIYRMPYRSSWLKSKNGKKLFAEDDRALLELLDIEEFMSKCGFNIELSYHNKVFRLRVPNERSAHGRCHVEVAPAWFRAKMFLGEPVEYKTDKYTVRWDKANGLRIEGDTGNSQRTSLFSGNENLPDTSFDVDLTSDSWDGLLEKWARLAFEMIQMR
jgi:hypothetical protein